MDIKKAVLDLAIQAKNTSYNVMNLSTKQKNSVLNDISLLLLEKSNYIIEENHKDVKSAKEKNITQALIDRLTLDEKRITSMADAVKNIIKLEDPVGKTTWNTKRPNGLKIARVRVPIGVIVIIYESRPNVTIDSFALSFKASNTVILRGGSESIHSNTVLISIIKEALVKNNITEHAVSTLPVTDREAVMELIKLNDYLDLVIPRGGESLIRSITENSRVPVIKHYKGICHIFIDESADTEKAIKILLNAKTQRPGVCNAAESVLIHKNFKDKKRIIDALIGNNVEVRADDELMKLNSKSKKADEKDWSTEYLDMIISAKEVGSVEEAINHINHYSSHHSDSIITKNKKNSEKFLAQVDSAAVYENASTRFTDGGEFGFGAEIGISTDKIHCRGPMGLEELTSYKYIIHGNGQTRK